MTTPNLDTVEIKAFVPAKDFELSKRFYQALGFRMPWCDDDLAYLHCGDCSFLLQNFHVPEHTANFQMHLLVQDVVSLMERHFDGAELSGVTRGTRTSPSSAWPNASACASVHPKTSPGPCATSCSSTPAACSGASRRTSRALARLAPCPAPPAPVHEGRPPVSGH